MDNLCGPSEEGLKKASLCSRENLVKDRQKIKIFIIEEFDHGSD